MLISFGRLVYISSFLIQSHVIHYLLFTSDVWWLSCNFQSHLPLLNFFLLLWCSFLNFFLFLYIFTKLSFYLEAFFFFNYLSYIYCGFVYLVLTIYGLWLLLFWLPLSSLWLFTYATAGHIPAKCEHLPFLLSVHKTNMMGQTLYGKNKRANGKHLWQRLPLWFQIRKYKSWIFS